MYSTCEKCPHFSKIRPFVEGRADCGDYSPELAAPCLRCARQARKHDGNFLDEDRLRRIGDRKKVSIADAAILGENGTGDCYRLEADFTRAPSPQATGLEANVEDSVRKAICEIVQRLDYADVPAFMACLRGEKNKRFDSATIARVESVLASSRSHIHERAALQAVSHVAEWASDNLKDKDASVLLAVLRGRNAAEMARELGLSSRQTAHARVKSLLARLPELGSLLPR